jgi:predicted ATPase/class 3 adenylate cyclase
VLNLRGRFATVILMHMRALPSGTVTFLFTDVAGSTALLARSGPEGYAVELTEHRRILRAACAAWGGVEVDTAGDGFFVVFSRAADAIAAAQAAQAGLSDGPVRVRMGLHTGEPLLSDGGYVGMDVHRAARIAAAGHGGQVLVSQATHNLVVDADFLDLGEHRLKDLIRPERLYQLGAGEFPPPKSLNRTNLPLAANPLVGRVVEQAELTALLRERHLVTITGTGGTGKTRLALQIAAELLEEFADGTFFVPLAGLTDPDLVVPAVTQTLGLTEAAAISQANALIVLDNFEHLLDAAPSIARLLAEAPSLKLLVTSRTPLRLSLEAEYPLDPLLEDAAVELFLHRAQSIQRPVEPSKTVHAICRRLDGQPLALELAAARLKLLEPAALLDRLEERLPLLTQGPLDLPERQRTLEATIAWSYDLLDPVAQALFTRLAVFAETFGIHAAEQIAAADLDTLATLADASLMKPIGENRCLLLGTIREYGARRLEGAERERLAADHAAYYLELAERATPELTGEEAATWLARLDSDHANLRAALDALTEPRDVIRLTKALWRFWLVRGHFQEARTRIEYALGVEPGGDHSADLHYYLGAILISRGDTADGGRLFVEALARYRARGDRLGEARSVMALGHVSGDLGDWEPARGYYREAAELCREIGDELGVAGVLGDLASMLVRAGQAEEALPIAAESVELARRLGYEQGVSLVLATQAYACLAVGELEQARVLLMESTELAHRLGYQHGLIYSLNAVARLAYETGDLERAADAFAAAQQLRREIGIEHDPDDSLVAEARAAVEAALDRRLDGTDATGLDLAGLVAGL